MERRNGLANMSAEDEGYIHRALSEASAELSRFSYPLFALDGNSRPDLYASCLLLDCDGIPVLVTASHAICEIEKTGRGIYVGAKHIRQVPGQFARSSKCGNDPLDIAGIVFSQEMIVD